MHSLEYSGLVTGALVPGLVMVPRAGDGVLVSWCTGVLVYTRARQQWWVGGVGPTPLASQDSWVWWV